MSKRIDKNRNTTDTVSHAVVALNNSTAVVIQAANDDRDFFHVNNDGATQGFWVRYYPAAQDNIKQGFWVSGKNGLKSWHDMSNDINYTGEISAISDAGTPNAYVTEY